MLNTLKSLSTTTMQTTLQGAELALQYKYQKQPRFVYGYNLDYITRISIDTDYVCLYMHKEGLTNIYKNTHPDGYREFILYLQSQVIHDDVVKTFDAIKSTLE